MSGQNFNVINQTEIWEFSLQDYSWRFLTYITQELDLITDDLFYNSIDDQVIIMTWETNTLEYKGYLLTEENEITQIEALSTLENMYLTEYIFIAEHNYLFTFGGYTESFSLDNNTRIFDFETNESIFVNSTMTPSSRARQSLVYDQLKDQIILFGGFESDGDNLTDLNDTWIFNLDTFSWTEKTIDIAPDARVQSRMVYDNFNNEILLFGGASTLDRDLYYDDLWSLDIDTYQWKLINSSLGVGKMALPNLEYISSTNSIILSGGYIGSPRLRHYENTWEISLVHSGQTSIVLGLGRFSIPSMAFILGVISVVAIPVIIIYKRK